MKIGKINIVSIGNSTGNNSYLAPLKEVAQAPKHLYVAGSIPKSRVVTVAIVGTRRPTAYGREITERFAGELARRGVVVISGLALGVDAVAHQAVLDAGGLTIAVLAGGLHRIYPASHLDLARRIVKSGGAIVSEHPEGFEAHPYHFLARNRLVSGLADAVLVTEAAERSGTFSTVGHALEQGKEVFAVPGPITSLMSAGANKLIQQGAHVALTPDDVLRIIAPELMQGQTKLVLGDTTQEVRIIELLRSGVRDGDELQKESGIEPSLFLQTLTMLEIKGTISPLGANKWTIL